MACAFAAGWHLARLRPVSGVARCAVRSRPAAGPSAPSVPRRPPGAGAARGFPARLGDLSGGPRARGSPKVHPRARGGSLGSLSGARAARVGFIPAHGRRRVSLNCCPSAIYGCAPVTASRNCQPNRWRIAGGLWFPQTLTMNAFPRGGKPLPARRGVQSTVLYILVIQRPERRPRRTRRPRCPQQVDNAWTGVNSVVRRGARTPGSRRSSPPSHCRSNRRPNPSTARRPVRGSERRRPATCTGSLGRSEDDRLRSPLVHGHLQRLNHQRGAKMPRHGPTDDAPAEHVEDDGQVQEAGQGRDVGVGVGADSLSLRSFLDLKVTESAPDHSTLSRTRRLIDVETHVAVVRQANWRRMAGESPAEGRSNQPPSPRVMRRSL